MGQNKSRYRRVSGGQMWLCPPAKRLWHEAKNFESRCLPVVLYNWQMFDLHGDHYKNHKVFEFLHNSVSGLWHVASTNTFFYLGSYHLTGIYFESLDDAMLLQMAVDGGMLLADYAATVSREHDLKRLRTRIDSLSKQERERQYPELDEFLLSRYEVPVAKP